MGRKKLSVCENNQRMVCAQLTVDASEQGLSDLGGAFSVEKVEVRCTCGLLFLLWALVTMPQCLY